MEIIRRGRPQTQWTIETLCSGGGNGGGGCDAKLRVALSDLYFTHRYPYDGSHDVFVTFTCPCCSVETDLDHLPSTIISKIPKDRKQADVLKNMMATLKEKGKSI